MKSITPNISIGYSKKTTPDRHNNGGEQGGNCYGMATATQETRHHASRLGKTERHEAKLELARQLEGNGRGNLKDPKVLQKFKELQKSQHTQPITFLNGVGTAKNIIFSTVKFFPIAVARMIKYMEGNGLHYFSERMLIRGHAMTLDITKDDAKKEYSIVLTDPNTKEGPVKANIAFAATQKDYEQLKYILLKTNCFSNMPEETKGKKGILYIGFHDYKPNTPGCEDVPAMQILARPDDVDISDLIFFSIQLSDQQALQKAFDIGFNINKLFYASGNAKSGNTLEQTILQNAAYTKACDIETFQMILDRPGIHINTQDTVGRTALHLAIETRSDEKADLLLKKDDIDLTLCDTNGNTPLHYIAKYGDESFFEELRGSLEQKTIPLGAKNKQGQTALHIAAQKGNAQFAEFLLNHDSLTPEILNAQDMHGKTILHYAVQNKDHKFIDLLLKNKTLKLNLQNREGKTPFFQAIENEDIEAFQILREKMNHRDFRLKDSNGRTHLDYIEAVQDPEIKQQMMSILQA